jgi:hypothetical protein
MAPSLGTIDISYIFDVELTSNMLALNVVFLGLQSLYMVRLNSPSITVVVSILLRVLC